MSVADDPKTFGRARLRSPARRTSTSFVTTLERYERGELTPTNGGRFALLRGTYGQRSGRRADAAGEIRRAC